MAAAVWISSSRWRGSVILLTHQHGPGAARGLVGDGNGHEPGRFSPEEGPHPGTCSGVGRFGAPCHRGGADNQQASWLARPIPAQKSHELG